MSAITLKSRTGLQNCCKMFLGKAKTPAGWCMASRAFRSARRSLLKSFLKWRGKGSQAMYARLVTVSAFEERLKIQRRIYGDDENWIRADESGADFEAGRRFRNCRARNTYTACRSGAN